MESFEVFLSAKEEEYFQYIFSYLTKGELIDDDYPEVSSKKFQKLMKKAEVPDKILGKVSLRH